MGVAKGVFRTHCFDGGQGVARGATGRRRGLPRDGPFGFVRSGVGPVLATDSLFSVTVCYVISTIMLILLEH